LRNVVRFLSFLITSSGERPERVASSLSRIVVACCVICRASCTIEPTGEVGERREMEDGRDADAEEREERQREQESRAHAEPLERLECGV
jgi:hypothetical protein